MQIIRKLIFKDKSNEEFLPGYTQKFPIISTYVELDKYPERYVPWHWHDTLELFYMESGVLEYHTPEGTKVFPAGTGGIVNSNVLHMTKILSDTEDNIQLVHLFDTSFIAGEKGSLIDEKYIRPFVTNSKMELVAFYPENPNHVEILKVIRDSFYLQENEKGYEIRLRENISSIWLMMLELLEGKLNEYSVQGKSNHQMKQMMLYVQEHYSEKITIAQLANAAYLSERGCYRVFQEYIHMTPMDYIISYRLQMACQMLLKEEYSLAEISLSCGFGSSSYFGKIFKERMGCTPLEYRHNWQNSDI